MSFQRMIEELFSGKFVIIRKYTDIPDYVPEPLRDEIMQEIAAGKIAMMPKNNPFERKDGNMFEDLAAKLLADSQGRGSFFPDVFEEAFGMSPSKLDELSRQRMKAGCDCDNCRRRREQEEEAPAQRLSEKSEAILAKVRVELELLEADQEAIDLCISTMAKNRIDRGLPVPEILILGEAGNTKFEARTEKV